MIRTRDLHVLNPKSYLFITAGVYNPVSFNLSRSSLNKTNELRTSRLETILVVLVLSIWRDTRRLIEFAKVGNMDVQNVVEETVLISYYNENNALNSAVLDKKIT